MDSHGWYLVAYDVALPRRLKRVHRLLVQEGLAVQESLFFVHADEKKMEALLDRLASVMHLQQDDLRAYPITNPGDVWSTGKPIPTLPTAHPSAAPSLPLKGKATRFKAWVQTIFKR